MDYPLWSSGADMPEPEDDYEYAIVAAIGDKLLDDNDPVERLKCQRVLAVNRFYKFVREGYYGEGADSPKRLIYAELWLRVRGHNTEMVAQWVREMADEGLEERTPPRT